MTGRVLPAPTAASRLLRSSSLAKKAYTHKTTSGENVFPHLGAAPPSGYARFFS